MTYHWYSPIITLPPKLVNGFLYPARSELVEVVKEKK